MKTATWRPERRNRKIGTSSSGHGANNRMVIPNSRVDRFGYDTVYQERMTADYTEQHSFGGTEITILYENPRPGFSYGCTPADIVHLLKHLPEDDITMIDIIAFRQPTRKQSARCPVWGRLEYGAVIDNHIGPAIILEAQEIGSVLRWPKKQSLEDRLELERLRDDGHEISETKRYHLLKLGEEAVRNTILYRTLLHEIGHMIQYGKDVLDETTSLHENSDIADDLYFARPDAEREQFAHRYATESAKRLRQSGVIPFSPAPDGSAA